MITVLSPADENILVDVTILTIKRREGFPATQRCRMEDGGKRVVLRSLCRVLKGEKVRRGCKKVNAGFFFCSGYRHLSFLSLFSFNNKRISVEEAKIESG